MQFGRGLGQPAALLLAQEQVSQVGHEPRHLHRCLVDPDTVFLADDVQDAVQIGGHLRGRGHVRVELRVHQMQGQWHGLHLGQPDAAIGGHQVEHVPGHRDLGRIQVLHLPAQRVFELGDALRRPAQGEAQMVGQRQQHMIADPLAEPGPGELDQTLGECDVVGGDVVDHRGDPVGAGRRTGDEPAFHPARVDHRSRCHLEAQSPAEQHQLAVLLVDGQHDVVVEHLQHPHRRYLLVEIVARRTGVGPDQSRRRLAPSVAITSRYQSKDFLRYRSRVPVPSSLRST